MLLRLLMLLVAVIVLDGFIGPGLATAAEVPAAPAVPAPAPGPAFEADPAADGGGDLPLPGAAGSLLGPRLSEQRGLPPRLPVSRAHAFRLFRPPRPCY